MSDQIISLGAHWNSIQRYLIPDLEDEIGQLDAQQRAFVEICEILLLDRHFTKYSWCGNGRPPHSRLAVFKFFVMKALWNLPTTRAALSFVRSSPVMRRLCGWESLANIPHESSFSRDFAEFSESDVSSKIQKLTEETYLGPNGVFHVSHDSTAIEAREKGRPKEKRSKQEKKSDVSPDEKSVSRIERQSTQDADTNFGELPTDCDWGCKRNSKGKCMQWKGYKLHITAGDGDIPLFAFLSSASMHDSQAMIPMMQRTSERFDYFYDLADAGYDARVIKEVSRQLGHAPIIDRNAQRGEKNVEDPGAKVVNVLPADKVRYNHRTGVERVFSHLHDSHGGKFVRVRGAKKVFLHLMFGLLVIMAEQILKLTT